MRTLIVIAALVVWLTLILGLVLARQWGSAWLLIGAGFLIENIAHTATEEG